MSDQPRTVLPHGHPGLDSADFGWRPDPAGNEAFLRSLPHGGTLSAAAPQLLGDGAGQDLMPYKGWYEIEVTNPDGKVWKAKGEEPPYIPQTGNNCTSEGLMHCSDLLQVMDQADPEPGASDAPVFTRTCVETTYAFGLHKAGMSGDNGCYGGAMAAGASEIGLVPYRDVPPPYDETRQRLSSFARSPKTVVDQYAAKAAPYRLPAPVKITTVKEAVAWVANRGLITIASNVGFNSPRDEKGVCRRRGYWPHQMAIWGVLVSDGVETAVVAQSWGPNNPDGPRPFALPSFCFRITFDDFQRVLDQGDSWGFRKHPGFDRKPLPSRWTNAGWGR